MTMRTFDATVSFEEPLELEHELTQVTRTMGDFHTLTAIVRCDNDVGELYKDDETFIVREDDWCVTGNSIWDVAKQLRALL